MRYRISIELIKAKANSLLNVPMEQWHENGLPLKACSANSNGQVNSFIHATRGLRFYGYRKHEFKDGQWTGKQWFEVEQMTPR